MAKQIKALIEDDDTIYIDGQALTERIGLVDALRSAVESDPELILVIAPLKQEYFKGTGKVIYASLAAGVPAENLRYTMPDGEVLTFDELRARGSAAPV